MESFNPYAAPKAKAFVQESEAERMRRKHIRHESSIKTLGGLCVLGGVLIVFGIGRSLFQAVHAGASAAPTLEQVVFAAMGLGLAAMGIGLQRLQKWAALAAIVLGVILCIITVYYLPASFIGLIILGVIVMTLLSARTRTIVSADYKRIIAETPHVKPKASIAVWVLLGVMFVLAVGYRIAVSR